MDIFYQLRRLFLSQFFGFGVKGYSPSNAGLEAYDLVRFKIHFVGYLEDEPEDPTP